MRSNQGFTLVELLIVTAIILVLGALLLPVVNYAKSSAKQTSCASNMHQLYIALELYCQDAGGWENAPHGLTMLSSYAPPNVFTCPEEDSLVPDAEGQYPEAILWQQPHGPESPFRISYAYVRDYPLASEENPWRNALAQPSLGVLACQWHGSLEPGYFSPYPDFLQPRKGLVLRICLDGHVFRWQRTDIASVTTSDMFTRPMTIKQVYF